MSRISIQKFMQPRTVLWLFVMTTTHTHTQVLENFLLLQIQQQAQTHSHTHTHTHTHTHLDCTFTSSRSFFCCRMSCSFLLTEASKSVTRWSAPSNLWPCCTEVTRARSHSFLQEACSIFISCPAWTRTHSKVRKHAHQRLTEQKRYNKDHKDTEYTTAKQPLNTFIYAHTHINSYTYTEYQNNCTQVW